MPSTTAPVDDAGAEAEERKQAVREQREAKVNASRAKLAKTG